MSALTVDLLDGEGYNGATLFLATAALISTVVAAYFAREALFPPRRRLVVRVLSPVSLLHADAGLLGGAEGVAGITGAGGVEVSRNGEPIPDPYVVTVLLRNTGRHAISTAQFDQQRPITIDIKTSIVAVLSPAGPVAPATVEAEGTTLRFHPDLIRQKQEISIQLLTSGRPGPDLTVSEHLVDTRVDVERGGVDQHPSAGLEQHLPIAFAVAGTVGLITLIIADVLLGG
ncbi:hypothetical protein O7608_27520 [Solwaraspora sp. WMMA2056]|uniref:hypothetical protein n=1 Tax=Solwaraspora sp. WMMA2056 TaxID=3015161 RepID=UPI00259B8AED|nr:hypothetical protein [Solwaraspora sp. WMMA2056]WJK40127.1 hypothetical protein O7608_27520 [Solwaraspora sp. WMMA2056]